MYYLIGRDLDADGSYEFIKDMDNMILTEDANSALQMTEAQLGYLDMAYLNEAGFYALEADRFRVSILEQLLFAPMVMGFRPRVAPPPRRRRRPAPPPPPRRPHRPAPRRPRAAACIMDAMLTPGPARPKRGPKPRPAGVKHGRKPRSAAPAGRSGAGRGPASPFGGRGPGGRGPGGRGPGR